MFFLFSSRITKLNDTVKPLESQRQVLDSPLLTLTVIPPWNAPEARERKLNTLKGRIFDISLDHNKDSSPGPSVLQKCRGFHE